MKDKNFIILVVVIILMMIGLAIVKTDKPKPLDWTPTFINSSTDPYGTYITYQLLGDIFEQKNIRSTRRPVYNNLRNDIDNYFGYDESEVYNGAEESEYSESEVNEDSYYDESEQYIDTLTDYVEQTENIQHTDPSAWYRGLESLKDTTSYIFIHKEFYVDKLDLGYLLDFVGLGNNVFISAESFSRNLLDSLQVKTKVIDQKSDTLFSLIDFPDKKYRLGSIYAQMKLTVDIEVKASLPVTALAVNNNKDTVFLDIQYGKGHFYLHTVPSAFANIYLLDTDKYDFAFKSLSYLPRNSKIIWDEYQKQGPMGDDNMFRVMFDSTPLRIAFYLILLGLLLFMIFRAKRSQRVIPVINPPVNSSLEFLGTISNLYYRKKDFRDIVEKRQAYLLDFIRRNYYLSTENINDEFLSALSAKSGQERDKLNELFVLYKDIATLVHISNDMFLKYNSLLEEFYKKAKTNK